MLIKRMLRLSLILYLLLQSTCLLAFTPLSLVTAYFPYWSEELKSPVFPIPNNVLFLNPAFYFGFQGGYADNHWDTMSPLIIPGVTQVETGDEGFAFNTYMGYNYHYFSIEGGYLGLPNSHFNSTRVGSETSVIEITQYGLDFLIKGAVPLGQSMALYAKAGAGYVSSTIKGEFFNTNGNVPFSQSRIGPAVGIGFNWAITCNLIADLNWLRLPGQGQAFNGDFNYIPSPDLFLGGLVYKVPVNYF